MPNISDKVAAFHPHKHKSQRDWLFWSSFSPKHQRKHAASFASDFKPLSVPRIFWWWAWVLVFFLHWSTLERLVFFCSYGFSKNHLWFIVWINLSSERQGRRRILTYQSHNSRKLERRNYQFYKLFKFPHNPSFFFAIINVF